MSDSDEICLVVGTRPEAIKLVPVYFALQQTASFRPLLLSTGQHRQMLDQSLASFGVRPDHDLNLMQPGQTLADITSRVVSSVYDFLIQRRPRAVLVQGDTTTVLASALAAFYAEIPVGHVEAGLRTGDITNPWPEEANRRLVSPLATWNFCPTQTSRDNLLREQIAASRCFVVGNTVVDALLWMRDHLRRHDPGREGIAQRLGIGQSFCNTFFQDDRAPWILVTAHRRESHGDRLHQLCQGILQALAMHPELGVLFPVHLNPRVRETVLGTLADHDRIELIEPVGYEDFVWLMDRCTMLLSDSGGVQEEAPSLGKPVLVTRDTTERPEGVEAGTCRLIGTQPQRIVAEIDLLLSDAAEYTRRSRLQNPYGDGTAAQQICDIIRTSV